MIFKFYSSSCVPCKILSNKLNSLNFKDYISYNIDDSANYEKALKYKVMSLPSLIKVNDNLECIDRIDGLVSDDTLKQFLEI